MLHVTADGITKDIDNDLANNEEEYPKRNVTQRPTILQGVRNEDDLHHHVHEHTDPVNDVEDHEKSDSLSRSKTSPSLERQQRHGTGDYEHAERGKPKKPDRERSAIFVKLEADKAVDQETSAQGGGESILHGTKVRICS